MPVTETPVQFKTSDGRTWPSKEEAERHEELVQAREAYEQARSAYGLALARTQKTADGVPFDLGLFVGYFHVARVWGQPPRMEEVEFYRWDLDLNERDDAVRVHRGEGQQRRYFWISELYRHRDAAERALLAATEEWMAEHAAKLEELRARVKPAQPSPVKDL